MGGRGFGVTSEGLLWDPHDHHHYPVPWAAPIPCGPPQVRWAHPQPSGAFSLPSAWLPP